MPWKLGERTIREGFSWTDNNGITHPYNWSIWSNEEKTAAGLTWENGPALYNPRFYSSANVPRDLDALKHQYKQSTKTKANALLQETDWYVTRKAEDSTATIPSDIATYRAAVRTKSNTIETAIDNAADHAAFMALFDAPVDSDGNRTGNAPINDWPDEVE
tara:strand:- start:20 stop:502 length:483 start_codon:yes stop_codon:yes gene_type:complete